MDPFSALLPGDATEYPRGLYNPFPVFPCPYPLLQNYDQIAKEILHSCPRVVIIDGFHGVHWETFTRNLQSAIQSVQGDQVEKQGLETTWIDFAATCYHGPETILERIKPFLGGNDRVFGRVYPLGLDSYLVDPVKLADLKSNLCCHRGNARPGKAVTASTNVKKMIIVYGTGCGLLQGAFDYLAYVDVPKDLLQSYARSGPNQWLRNLGEDAKKACVGFSEFYKRLYFVEWPAQGKLKQQLLPQLNLFIDGQHILCSVTPSICCDRSSSNSSTTITAIHGGHFREVLHRISQSPFRVRPWFYPGVWGGQFMKGHMGLDPVAVNYAWSFELIVTENGIVLQHQSDSPQLEFSFDLLMFQEVTAVQGPCAAAQFGFEWPIRFDYLDTIDGGNLSTQCHPRPNYIRQQFGETYTQDETYYITNAKPGSKVYLGLTQPRTPKEFSDILTNSFNQGKEIEDFQNVVHAIDSQPHDLFLIPNGTVHCSGAGNLVLEISSTPYIFTFKLYDYVRRDLDGSLRPMNIDRGALNFRPERTKDFVEKNFFVRNPSGEGAIVAQGGNEGTAAFWRVVKLYDRPETFYLIQRAEFEDFFPAGDTQGAGQAVNLVEGETVDIVCERTGFKASLSYLETMLIPAAVGKYSVRRTKGTKSCKLLIAFVRPGTGAEFPVNNPNDDV